MNELTPKQVREIEIYLVKVWDHIYDNILIDDQRNNRDRMKMIAFDMETIYKSHSAMFGITGMSQ